MGLGGVATGVALSWSSCADEKEASRDVFWGVNTPVVVDDGQ